MNELTLFGELAEIIEGYGVVGVIVLFVAFLIWQEKQRTKNAEADRLVLTNHLSGMIKENSENNKLLAIGLTKLSESVNNFQSRCGQIQDDLQNEVDRMKRG